MTSTTSEFEATLASLSFQKDEVLRNDPVMEACRMRASSYKSRPSTLGARTFFRDWPTPPSGDTKEDQDHENIVQLCWRSLPQRVHELASYLVSLPTATPPDTDVSFIRSVTLSHDEVEANRIAFTAAVFCDPPPYFLDSWKHLFKYSLSLRAEYGSQQQQQPENHDEGNDHDYNSPRRMKDDERWTQTSEMDKVSSYRFDEIQFFHDIRTLGWLPEPLSHPLGQALHETIYEITLRRIKGNYHEEGLVDSLLAWKDEILLPWMEEVLGANTLDQSHTETTTSDRMMDNWTSKLDYAMAENFCSIRKGEIFDIVTDYPDSITAVEELAKVLRKTRMHHVIGKALREAFQRRLLHPGAQSNQILQVYMNSIKVLRAFDPSDSLLESVIVEITSYLRQRNDTVRCIVTSLTDHEGGGDLYDELHRHDVRPLEEFQHDSDDDEEPPTWDWKPSPSMHYQKMCGDMSLVTRRNAGGDVLSMLVGIYGSKDLFVDEYCLMLADKLLSRNSVDIDSEIHNLELLKIRFGETSMRKCEIMVKDMEDSKRINGNIHSTMKCDDRSVVDSVIISHHFWPSLQKEQLKHHPRIQARLDQFSTEYAKLKNPRQLIWIYQLGKVHLELDVLSSDGVQTKEFVCAPLQATLITHFEDEYKWSASELSNQVGLSEETVKKQMAYWVSNGVVRIDSSINKEPIYTLNSNLDCDTSNLESLTYDDGMESTIFAGAQEEEQLEMYESYIIGMLSNLGSLPLEKIHNMLKMYASAGSEVKYNHNTQQLRSFLQQLCGKERLECGSDGLYRLLKRS